MSQLSPFGHRLRSWRRQRGWSQLQLATEASTTARHVSFIETGRSRPGRELILRIAETLDLPVRDRNALLTSAGLPPVFAERDLGDAALRPFKMAVEAVLHHHDPYPGVAMDALGQIHMTNTGFRALWPEAETMTPEASVDAFFGPGPMRELIDNFAEVAWASVDGRASEAARTNDARMQALAERARAHLKGVPRSPPREGSNAVVCPRFRVGDQLIETFSTVMRFEHALDVTMSELRVELIFPIDAAGDRFFRKLGGSTTIADADSDARFRYFVREVIEQGELWGLHGRTWARAPTESGVEALAFWPSREFAAPCVQEIWSTFTPRAIELDAFLEQWLTGMEEDGIVAVVFPTPGDPGAVVDPRELARALQGAKEQ